MKVEKLLRFLRRVQRKASLRQSMGRDHGSIFGDVHGGSCAPDRERDLPHQSTGNGFEGVCNSDRSACRSRPCHSGLALHRSAGPGSENEALQIGALNPGVVGLSKFF